MQIGERSEGTPVQEWLNRLGGSTQNCFEALSGGRGIFRLGREQVEALKQVWQAREPGGETSRCQAVPGS